MAGGSFFEEIKRRKVLRVAVVYGAVAWVLIQLVNVIEEPLQLPAWADTFVIVLVAIGFPIALILTWAFDLTPHGVERTKPLDEGEVAETDGSAWVAIGISAFVVAAAGAGIWLYQMESEDAPAPKHAAVKSEALPRGIDLSKPVPGFSGRAAIAVMPFVNLSGDKDQEYFADGLAEDILTGLQSFGSFPVIARTSTFSYKEQAKDVPTIARELGAGYVLEGSVRRSGDQLRITAQLNDDSGVHLWAGNYDIRMDEVFAVQDEITNQIVRAIQPEVLATEMERVRYVRTEDLEAWDHYLRAMADTNVFMGYVDINGRPVTRDRNERARENLERAIELDPDFAEAYVLLAHVDGEYIRTLRPEVTQEFAHQALERAVKNAEIARSLSPFGSTACSCQAMLMLMKGDLETALRLQKEALLVNPSSSTVHSTMAKLLHNAGEHEKALEEIQLAKRLSPKDVSMSTYLMYEAEIYEGLGEFERAEEVAHRAALIQPENYDASILRITSLYVLGRMDRAREARDELYHRVPGFAPNALIISSTLPKALVDRLAPVIGDKSVLESRQALTQYILDALGAPEET